MPLENISLLQQLLRIPSLSGQESRLCNFIKKNFGGLGIETLEQGKNLVVHLQGKDKTRAVIFNSHMDVVDVGNEKDWKHAPWGGKVENGRIYGRGASDTKGGLFATVEVAKKLAREKSLPCDVWFTYVVKEEVDGSGTKSFVEWFVSQGCKEKYKEVAALLTEPTGLSIIEHGHRGNFFIKAYIQGEASHSGRPEQIAQNAILQIIKFIASLKEQTEEWKQRFADSVFSSPSIVCTSIKAESSSPNRISAVCEAVFDLRTIPGFHQEAYKKVTAIALEYGITLSLLFPPAPSGFTKPDSKLIRAITSLLPNSSLEVSQASADLGFFSEVGIDGVIFGPGEKEQAHTTDESASLSQILKAPDLFEKIYQTWANSKHK